MATALERQYLRDDVDADSAALPDNAADILFDRAADAYPTNARAREAHTRVLAILQLMAAATKQVDHQQGESQEKASQTGPALERLLKVWQAKEDKAVEDAARQATGGAMWGGLRVKPTRQQEYPDSH